MDNKVKRLKELLKSGENILCTIHYDDGRSIEARTYYNVTVRMEGNKLIIEDAGKQMDVSEANIVELGEETAKLETSDRDRRRILVKLLVR